MKIQRRETNMSQPSHRYGQGNMMRKGLVLDKVLTPHPLLAAIVDRLLVLCEIVPTREARFGMVVR